MSNKEKDKMNVKKAKKELAKLPEEKKKAMHLKAKAEKSTGKEGLKVQKKAEEKL